MHRTGLTMGGFTQPSVARGLIEHPPNVEKGLCQRFLRLAPQPTPTKFNELQCVDQSFIAEIGMMVIYEEVPEMMLCMHVVILQSVCFQLCG